MSNTRHGISSSAITWEIEETEISISETNMATITCQGVTGPDSSMTVAAAIALIPSTIPISSTGPIGSSSTYSGARLSKRGARYSGDGLYEVNAEYIIAVPDGLFNPSEGTEESDSDKASRMIAVSDEPILSHAVALAFPAKEKRLLSSLLAGDIWVNPRYDDEGEGSEVFEFIRNDESGEGIEKVEFGEEDVTVDGITASPLDYARMIAIGITSFRQPIIRHKLSMVRADPATNAEYSKVGEVVSSPNLAPTISGDFQWFLTGITDTTSNGGAWERDYEYDLSGAGGVLKYLYKGGSAELS